MERRVKHDGYCLQRAGACTVGQCSGAADRLIAYIGRLALDPDYKEEQKEEKKK